MSFRLGGGRIELGRAGEAAGGGQLEPESAAGLAGVAQLTHIASLPRLSV